MVGRFLLEYDNPTTIKTWGQLLTELAACNDWQHPHQIDAQGIVRFVTLPRKDGQPRANNSIRQRIAAVRTFHDYCRRNRIAVPDCEVVLRRLRKSHPRLMGKQQGHYEPNRLTRDQLQHLFDACRDSTWTGSRDQLAIRLLALGLRCHEVSTLTWGNLRTDGRISRLGKGNRLREVFPGPTLTDILDRWRRYYEHTIGPATDNAPVLVTYQLHPGSNTITVRAGIADQTLRRITADRAAAANLPHLSPHDLRRSLAKIMHDDGQTFTDIQAALGHSEASGAVTQACYIGPLENTGRITAGQLVD